MYAAVPPPPPLNINIESSVSNSVKLNINFDSAFSRDNEIETYCITHTSQSGTSESCLTPNSTYISDGLKAGGEYNFTITTINCGSQNGEDTEVFTVTPRGELKCVIT